MRGSEANTLGFSLDLRMVSYRRGVGELGKETGHKSPAVRHKRHLLPQQIISNAVWLYFRFPLSLRLVEEVLLERGIVVSYETIRR